MSDKIRVAFFILIFLLSATIFGQNSQQSISYIDTDIYAESFAKEDYGYRILSSLALANIKGLKWMYIHFEGRVLIQTDTTSDGHMYAYAKLIDYEISGEDHFRAFEIDSLLLPASISGKIQFSRKGITAAEMPVEILLSGSVVDLVGLGIPPDSLHQYRVRIDIDRVGYSRDGYSRYHSVTRMINNYYAYQEVLQYAVDRYSGSGIGYGQELADLLITWHELSRVRQNAEAFGFREYLHLDNYDPRKYLPVYQKFIRLMKRSTTLLNRKLEAKPVTSLDEKDRYCEEYIGISLRYYDRSKKSQPYISAGFLDIVKTLPSSSEFMMVREAAARYDVFNKLNIPGTSQKLYDGFIHQAEHAYEKGEWVLTLDLLYNASLFADSLPAIVMADSYLSIYENTLDRLMSAYLQVAIMAYRAENFEMAESYYKKALDIFNMNIDNLNGGILSSGAFRSFIDQQMELAYAYMDDEKFREGLKLVQAAQSISILKEKPESLQIDSALSIGYRGVYQQKLDSIGDLIETAKIENATEALELAAIFAAEKAGYIHQGMDPRMRDYAFELYHLYYERGERLMKGREPEKALFSFLEAQSINRKYLQESYPELDSLIYLATVPVILDLIEEAEFETWANRMDSAEVLRDKALALQERYRQQNNEELNRAFAELDAKMENRFCVNLANHCFALRKKMENRIRNRKFVEAAFLAQAALDTIYGSSTCQVSDSVFVATLEEFEHPVNYLKWQDQAMESLEKKEFERFMKLYEELSVYFHEHQLSAFGIENMELVNILENHPDQGLYLACISYYSDQKEFKTAYQYLLMAFKKGFDSRDFRNVQEEIGAGLALEDKGLNLDRSQKVLEYGWEDKWFRYLKNAYLRYP